MENPTDRIIRQVLAGSLLEDVPCTAVTEVKLTKRSLRVEYSEGDNLIDVLWAAKLNSRVYLRATSQNHDMKGK